MTAIERFRDPRVADACTAVALAVALELQLALGDDPGASLVNVLGGLALTLPLAFRRRAPLAVALAFAAAAVLQALLDGRLYAGEPPLLAALAAGVLAFFSLGAHAAERPALLGLGAGVAGLWATVLLSDHVDVQSFFFSAGLVALSPWLAGRTARARALRTAALERERDQRARTAASEERERIARELHDVVAHGVVLMVLQAQGARRILDADPERARAALGAIEETGQTALAELRRSLGMMRGGAAGAERAPQPTLADLDALVAEMRAAGMRVDVRVEGDARPLADGIDRSRVPDRPGGAHQHDPARRARADPRHRRVRRGRPGARDRRRRPAGSARRRARAGSGPRGHARARPALRRRARRAPARRPRLRGAGADPAGDMSLRVLLVDDHALARAAYRMVLDPEPDIEIVGEAADGRQAIHAAARLHPDVVLMDVRMPELDGIAATRAIVEAGAGARVLVLTTFDLDEYVYDALAAGASGFLLKDVGPEQLAAAIRVVAAGDALLAPSVTRRLVDELARSGRRPAPAPPALDELTPRELQVLRLLARGCSNAEIAAELVVEETTVKTHVSRLLAKLGLRDRVQAVVFAYEVGIAG